MLRSKKSRLITVLATAALSLGLFAGPAAANHHNDGLIDITAPIAVAANICNTNVTILSAAVANNQVADCDADADGDADGTVRAHKPGRLGDGLLVVTLPVAVAANVCNTNVSALSAAVANNQVADCDADADGDADGTAEAHKPGRGHHNDGLIDITAPIAVAANICNTNVTILSAAVANNQVADCDADADGDADGTVRAGDGELIVVTVPLAVAANICNTNVTALSAAVANNQVADCDADSTAEAHKPGKGKKKS